MYATYNPLPAYKAHATMQIEATRATGQQAAAYRAWATIKAKKALRTAAALKAWDTRLENEGAFALGQ
jgi:hypothetical protein